MKEKFATQDEKARFESFAKNHISHILKCGDLNHYWLRDFRAGRMSHAMEVKPDVVYLDVEIIYDEDYAVTQFRNKDWDELLRTLCHEISHILAAEIEILPTLKKMSKVLDPIYERFTEHASRWLYRLYTTQYMPEHGIEIATGIAKKKLK